LRISAYKGWIVAGLTVAAVIVAGRFVPVGEALKAFEHRVAELGAWAPILYGVLYVVAGLLLVPGSVLTIGAGVLFGLLWGTVVVSVASTVTAALAFLVSRHLARARVERMAARNDKFQAIDHAIREKGWKVVALLRLSPLMPFNVSNYLYGLTAIDFGHYVLASWAGMLPATVLYVYLGVAGHAVTRAHHGPTLGQWILLGAGLVATAVVTVMLTRAARRELARSELAKAPS
jgi:uncharacterized membrane protein YdjX (TVP38/TMEM64 family)